MPRLVVEPGRMYARAEAAKQGIVQEPLRDCYQHELGIGTPLTFDPMGLRKMNEALAHCGPYRVCFDWSTTGGDACKPGWHLYEIVQRGISQSQDTLTLVFSLQRRPDMEWPTGHPCVPGPWVIDELRRREKLKDTQATEIRARYYQREQQAQAKIEENAKHYEDEAAFVHNTPGLLRKVANKHNKVTTPKTQVRV